MESKAVSFCFKGSYDEGVVRDTATRLRQELQAKASCAFVFASIEYAEHLEDFVETLRLYGHIPEVFGCTGRGIIGSGVEFDEGAGFTILLLSLPDTTLTVRSFGSAEMGEMDSPEQWKAWSKCEGQSVNSWLALINPLVINIEAWLGFWNKAYPDIPCLGGLASSNKRADGITVFHNEEVVEGGLLIGLAGAILCEAVVSQGCRPIGDPFTITQVDRNVVYQLGSKSAFEVLSNVITGMNDEERETAKGNVFAGLATSEYLDDFKQGDFLVRNILSADPESGAVVIGSLPRVGQTLQYQLRDKISAKADMHSLLHSIHEKPKPLASLVFSCIGRGKAFFGETAFDAKTISDHLGEHPSAGFFCNGELGPVSGQNFVHGYTLTAALFRYVKTT